MWDVGSRSKDVRGMTFDIRLMTVEDFEAVIRFWRSTPGIGLREYDDNLEGFTRFLERNPHTCFCAVKGGRIIGTILAGQDGRRGYLYHTAVDPDERCHGIGSSLVDAAMAALKAEGIKKTALVVFSDNEGGNAFWEKQGFTSRPDLIYRNKENTD